MACNLNIRIIIKRGANFCASSLPVVSFGGKSHGSAGNQGFTPIKPSADSRLIYVSDSQGNDSNDCLDPARPCKTIVAGRNKMRAGYPDHLYLRRGDVWRDQTLDRFASGRSTGEPAVIAFYGDGGPRPKLENDSGSPIGRGEIRFLHIIGLEFLAYRLDPEHPDFTGSGKANIVMVANHRDLLFEDNKFSYVEVVSHKFTDSNGETFVPRNITLRRNIWKRSLNPAEPAHNYPDPDRTLADYNAHLGGTRSFEAFMDAVSRLLWRRYLTARCNPGMSVIPRMPSTNISGQVSEDN